MEFALPVPRRARCQDRHSRDGAQHIRGVIPGKAGAAASKWRAFDAAGHTYSQPPLQTAVEGFFWLAAPGPIDHDESCAMISMHRSIPT
jgi:hypothetical protein